MTKERKFYKALQDVFIGVKIEGEGGFVNLMRIKSNYYRKIEDILKKDIEEALKNHPKFRDEFDKLYSFFNRYFTESGSIYFNSTPFHNNIYEKVYTDEKDVILFWKTQMLYYVKTDRIFRSLPVEFDGFKLYFDASKIENKKANEKRSLVFELSKVRDDGTIVFGVEYSERGRKTKQDEILKAIKRKGIAITEEQLERAFRVFEKQSEVDFFINKNAKAFLQEQFKLWSYQYFWEGAKEWSADRVNQLQILKDIAFKIIDFISQFEDELVKIWNKPKFVKNSNYVITLDRIKDKKLIEKIKKHKNYPQQVKEWKELGIDKNNPKAPIDTKYFKDLELRILNQFDDLDKSLDGWLIKSENYQALNTILPKFKEKVQTIYIDPPFNKENDADYLYNVKYKDSTWASLLENRLRLAKDWLNKAGSIFVKCDYNGSMIVRLLMNQVFEGGSFLSELIWKRFTGTKIQYKSFALITDTIYVYSKSDKWIYNQQYEPFSEEYIAQFKFEDKNGKYLTRNFYSPGAGPARKFFGKLIPPPEGHHWRISQEKIDQYIEQGRIILDRNGFPKLKMYLHEAKGKPYNNLLSQFHVVQGSSKEFWGFPTQNPETLLKLFIDSTSEKGDLIMDFFLGSSTATAVAHKLQRKWIGVEMGDHFYTVALPRMKEVLAGQGNHESCGISKDVDWQGGGFFKYYELEQYEEALANCKYEDGDLFNAPGRSPYQEYVFMKDEKMLKALEIDYKNNKVKVDLDKLYPNTPSAYADTPLQKGNIDIAETLSNLTGKWIKKVNDAEVEFEDGTKINTKDLDYKLIKPLIWW
jgi:adenine specific DNA methylase Mod